MWSKSAIRRKSYDKHAMAANWLAGTSEAPEQKRRRFDLGKKQAVTSTDPNAPLCVCVSLASKPWLSYSEGHCRENAIHISGTSGCSVEVTKLNFKLRDNSLRYWVVTGVWYIGSYHEQTCLLNSIFEPPYGLLLHCNYNLDDCMSCEAFLLCRRNNL